MAKPSGSPASFIERDLLSGSHTGSAPTHETSRPSAKIPVRNTHNTESTRKVVSAAPRSWLHGVHGSRRYSSGSSPAPSTSVFLLSLSPETCTSP